MPYTPDTTQYEIHIKMRVNPPLSDELKKWLESDRKNLEKYLSKLIADKRPDLLRTPPDDDVAYLYWVDDITVEKK